MAVVYALFIAIYSLTLAYCIIPSLPSISAFLNLLFFTLLTGLALWSHVAVMTTNPGVLPKGYKALDERKVGLKLAKLFDERESLFMGPQVRKLLRSGQVDRARELKEQSERNSVYTKAKESMRRESMAMVADANYD